MIKSKRGSHVGVVISFVLFITFVLFMYILLNSRVNQQSGKASALEYVKGEVIEKVSGEMAIVSVKLNDLGASCVSLDSFLENTGINGGVIARDDNGNFLDTEISGQNLEVDREANTFFRVYRSVEFPIVNEQMSCQAGSYTIGLSKAEKFIFESKITGLLVDYSADYENLKTELNIGSRDEFGFVFAYNNGTVLSTPLSNVSVNVYASQTPVQYIKTDGAREAGLLTVLVW